MNPAPAHKFANKTPAQITEELLGFLPSCIEAALRYRESGEFKEFNALLPGMISFHQPRGATSPPGGLTDAVRLKEDLGLDSRAQVAEPGVLSVTIIKDLDTRDPNGAQSVGPCGCSRPCISASRVCDPCAKQGSK